MIKEIHWKLIAQCVAGMLSGMICGTIGFFIGIHFSFNGKIDGIYGILMGIIIGSILSPLLLSSVKIKSYKNISITESVVVFTIIVMSITTHYFIPLSDSLYAPQMLAITAFAFSIFMGISFIPSLITTLCIFLYKKYVKKSS